MDLMVTVCPRRVSEHIRPLQLSHSQHPRRADSAIYFRGSIGVVNRLRTVILPLERCCKSFHWRDTEVERAAG